MSLITWINLTKSFNSQKQILDHVDFTISPWQKIALVAKNWAGKSTLLKVLLWKEEIIEWRLEYKRLLKIWYLSQDFDLDPNQTVADALFTSNDPAVQAIKNYEKILSDSNFAQEDLNEILSQIEQLKAREYEYKIKIIISKLQIDKFINQKVSTLSGGESKRVALAKVLVEEPELLILDEPTNHLDLEMIEWLENYLKEQNMTLLLVTHDRYFLERVCNEIWELDRWKLYKYDWNYSYFLEKKAERLENEKIEVHKLKQLYRNELSWIKKAPWARRTKQNFRQNKFYEIQDEYSSKKSTLANETVSMEISMQERQLWAKIVKMRSLNKKFWDKTILKNFSHEFAQWEHVWVIGKNWVGKTTFINIIMWNEPVDSWILNIWNTVSFWYYHQKEVDFPQWKRIIDVVRDVAEFMVDGKWERISASFLLEKFLFPASVQHLMADSLSGWEKRRLFLITILMKNPNFLILDEPTNDLDLVTLWVLEEFLINYNWCLLIISHDRFFMDRIVDHLFIFEWNGEVKDYWWTYTEYKEEIDEKKKIIKPKSDKKEEIPDEKQKKKLSYQEKQEFDKLERELQKLEKRKSEISILFENPDLPMEDIQKYSNELNDIIKTIEEKELRWFEISEGM